MKKINQKEYGYINYEKKIRFLMLLLYIFIGIMIFVAGYIINNGNRANLFTIIAFLSVLPAAKRFIAWIILLPYKTPPAEHYHKVKEMISPDTVLISDYVFTSEEKAMSVDFLIIKGTSVMGVTSVKGQNLTYLKDYLQKSIQDSAPEAEVTVVRGLDELEELYQKAGQKGMEEKSLEAVMKQLRIIAV